MKKALIFFLVIVMVSCSKDVVDPVNENLIPDNGKEDTVVKHCGEGENYGQEKNQRNDALGHDQWTKVIFTFTEGAPVNEEKIRFRGYKNDNNLKFKTVQQFSFEQINGEVQKKGDTIKLVKDKYYALEIHYCSMGKLMNYQFTTKEMAPIHQHFFITDPKKGTVMQTQKNTIDYYYRDTKPDHKMLGDQGVSLRDVNDPIGLKGYFKVFKNPKHIFDLNVVLVHVIAGKKQDENNNPYPFYAPSIRVIGTRDLSVKIPMKIFTDIHSASYVNDVSKEFNISKTQVNKELQKRMFGNLSL